MEGKKPFFSPRPLVSHQEVQSLARTPVQTVVDEPTGEDTKGNEGVAPAKVPGTISEGRGFRSRAAPSTIA